MKKFIAMFAFAAMAFGWASCSDDEDGYRTYPVEVQLTAPVIGDNLTRSEAGTFDMEGIEVTASGTTGTQVTATTNAAGKASFDLPEDVYTFSAFYTLTVDGVAYPVNFTQNFTVSAANFAGTSFAVAVEPIVSQGTSQVRIKEVYTGGCQTDDGSGYYQWDKYIVIYNNSAYEADIKNFCVSNAGPYNANAGFNNYVDDKLVYADAGYTPAHAYFFYMQNNLVLAPYTSATIVLCGAIDHTGTYKNSVDLSHADYVCYDVEDFWKTSSHPVPSENIPEANYLLASKYCLAGQNGAAWSMVGPGMFIFSTGDNEPNAYGQDVANRYYFPGWENNAVYAGTKIPNEWIFDAVDIWGADYVGMSKARFSATLDAGSIYMTNKQGYSIYRNVDKEATEALPENEGKLVYNYSLGTTYYDDSQSTDPSGIDAEASIKNGAHIVYKDTNNSGNDFHQRKQASLKD